MAAIRRVVTGHDEHGRARVLSDTVEELHGHRPGESSGVLWVTRGFPVDNDDATDRTGQETRTSEDDGTVFRVIRLEPGVAPRRHRTSSIDYAVVLSGSVRMELDEGSVRLAAGDCLVQRGTVHNWINDGPEACVIAFTLVGARPATANGGSLVPTG